MRIPSVCFVFAVCALAQDIIVTSKATGPLADQQSFPLTYKKALVTYSIGNAVIDGTGKVNLSIGIANRTGQLPSGLQFTLQWTAADITSVSLTIAGTAASAGKNIQCNPSASSTVCIVSGGTNGIADGAVASVAVQTSLTSSSQSTVALLGAVSANIQANAIDSTVTAGGGVVTMPALLAGPPVCSPNAIEAGQSAACTVALNKPALTAITIGLISGDPGLISMPASVPVAAGQTSATFQATAQ